MKKMSFILMFSYFLTSTLTSNSQNFKNVNKKANQLFAIECYEEALPLLLWMDSISPGNAELNYKIGFCYLHSTSKAKSLSFLLSAKNGGFSTSGIDMNIGVSKYANYMFDDAIVWFDTALKKINKTDIKKIADVKNYIKKTNVAKALVSNPVDVSIVNLGAKINSACPEYAPVIASDETILIFTSRRPCFSKDSIKKNLFEDIYISEKDSSEEWRQSYLMNKQINSSGHDASIALSPSGNKLLIYKDVGNGDIFESEYKGNTWTVAKKLPNPINSSFWEPSGSLSSDENTLFFVSNRPGGFGGRDIYSSTKNSQGIWSKPKNLGRNINTSQDEDAPFIHASSKVLYFSSEGHENMGGFDIFYSNYNEADSTWTIPKNIGYPINTIEDDLFFVWSADGKRGYYASDKAGGYGDKDIYKVTRNHIELPLIVMKGNILDENTSKGIGSKITITDNASNEKISVHYSNDTTGKYTIFLTPGKNYGILVESKNHLLYSENIEIIENKFSEINKIIKLSTLNDGKTFFLHNVFFDTKQAKLKAESYTELNIVAEFMKTNSKFKFEISGHTDEIGDSTTNLRLSEARALNVLQYLINKGVGKKRLISKGYGESYPLVPNDSEKNRKINRRTEFKLLK